MAPAAGTAPIDGNGHRERTADAWPTTDVAPPVWPGLAADEANQPALSSGMDAPVALDPGVASVEADATGVIAEQDIDDDVAHAVAEAELARLAHEKAEAERIEAERVEAERAAAAELAAEAERVEAEQSRRSGGRGRASRG